MAIEELIKQGEALLLDVHEDRFDTYVDYNKFDEWQRLSLMFLQQYYPDHPQTKSFEGLIGYGHTTALCNNCLSILKAFHKIKPHQSKIDYDGRLTNLFERFHVVARQIRRRHEGRTTLEIRDEYDVQDLLHGLLKLDFEDVRPEEYTPATAGAATRMDFLLKDDEIAIEVKMTRPGLKDKELGEQLIIDIFKYQSHPNCKCLYCFVYDPDNVIRNPRGMEKDLEKLGKGFPVKVYIRPL